MLQAAHISDDEYFSHMVLDDLNLIIRDIREFHKKDNQFFISTALEIFDRFQIFFQFIGNGGLGRTLKKSKKMGTPISQRKKR